MNRDIKSYRIILYPKIKAEQGKVVGLVIHENDDEFKVPIILDDKELKRNHYRTLMTFHDKDTNKYFIYLTQKFYNIVMSDKNYSLVGIWHEIGHIHDGFHFESDEEGRSYRRNLCSTNKINLLELGADSFAVQMTSKSTVISFIDIMIRERKNFNDANAVYTINEYNLRKKAIQKLKI